MERDHVDQIVAQWHRERPDLDVSGMEVIGRLGRLQKSIQQRLDAVFKAHDLQGWEFDVLATLLRSGSPHSLTPGDLMESTMITSGAMTNRVDRLQQRGFVARSKGPTDGRQVFVTLTPRGKDVVDAALTDHAANELEIVSALSDAQQRQLIKLIRLLQDDA